MSIEDTPTVDVVVLTRDERPISKRVVDAIHSQSAVKVQVFRVVGTNRPADENRWATIARARNVGRTLGTACWLMFVDDDVVLARECISRLLLELREDESMAAVAADYLGEQSSEGASVHVAMGATIFRREVLQNVQFRSETNRCECQCMVDDLRREGLTIDYSPVARATHVDKSELGQLHRQFDGVAEQSAATASDEDATELVTQESNISVCATSPKGGTADGEILVAFDRHHMGLFRGQLLRGLRAAGNHNIIHAVTYGLRDKQVRSLNRLKNVRTHPQPFTVNRICRNRMLGFQLVLRDLGPSTPVAYWDAGDVLFQTALDPVWDIVRDDPELLHVVEEPLAFEENPGQQDWIQSISNPEIRRHVFSLLTGKPVVNGGFIASSAGRLLSYFEAANQLINGDLLGAGGGDQVVLNTYRYTFSEQFRIIDETWNYCLVGRSGRHCKVRQGKYIDVLKGREVAVVHGNAGTLV